MKELTPAEARKKLGMTKKDPEAQPIAAIPRPTPAAPQCAGCGAVALADDMPFNVESGRCARCHHAIVCAPGRLQGGHFEFWATGHVLPREDNPRIINEKSKSFQELVASVRSAGIITPGIARPHPQLPGKLELLAGHRRHRAAQVCGLTEFPVIVRALDDRTAMEVLVFENLDRENLLPLEEARGVDLLLRSQYEPAEIASRMGKTTAWIARRVQLLQLTAQWKEWAEEWQIGAAHLELIARMPRAMQEEMFDQLTEDEYTRDEVFSQPGSLAKLRARINEELRELKHAPWALDNSVLYPKAGACSACPKRSGCQPDLFNEPEDAGDQCLDPECWKEKMAVFQKQREAELRKEHKDLVLIKGGGSVDWKVADAARKRGALEEWHFTECKKGSEGAVPALIVCGKGEGSLTWVKLQERGRGTREGAAKAAKQTAATKQAAASLDPAASAKLLAEKQEAHELRRWAEVAKRLQRALDESSLPAAVEFRTAEGLVRLVRVFGAEFDSATYWSERGHTWQRVERPCGMETLELVWKLVKPKIRTTLEVYKVSDLGAETRAAIDGVAMLLGFDVAVLKEDADAEIPEPKSWEQLRRLSEAPAPAKGAKAGNTKPSAKKKGKAA